MRNARQKDRASGASEHARGQRWVHNDLKREWLCVINDALEILPWQTPKYGVAYSCSPVLLVKVMQHEVPSALPKAMQVGLLAPLLFFWNYIFYFALLLAFSPFICLLAFFLAFSTTSPPGMWHLRLVSIITNSLNKIERPPEDAGHAIEFIGSQFFFSL